MQVAVFALRAADVHTAIADLALQLAVWAKEKPGDEQSKAFQQVRDWLLSELSQRGLTINNSGEGQFHNRAGAIAWKLSEGVQGLVEETTKISQPTKQPACA